MRPIYTRPSEARLEDMIARHMASPGSVKAPDTPADFVISALRAAYSATPSNRRKILADLASVMNCEPKDLGFLFHDFESATTDSRPYELMVPDFYRELIAAAK